LIQGKSQWIDESIGYDVFRASAIRDKDGIDMSARLLQRYRDISDTAGCPTVPFYVYTWLSSATFEVM
jgi:hypothetical protein